jgi:hypothetical protein
MKKLPANIDWYYTLEVLPELLGKLPQWVQKELDAIPSYFVNQDRGRAYSYNKKPHCFTLPMWILKRPIDYQVWYICHEASHILDMNRRGFSDHSAAFHKILKEICPLESQHYEWEYMKRSKARGLGEEDFLNLI